MTDFQREADRYAGHLASLLTTPVLAPFRNDHRVDLARFYEQDILDGDEATAWAMLSTGETSLLHSAYDLVSIGRLAGDMDDELRKELGRALVEFGSLLVVTSTDEREQEAEARDAYRPERILGGF